MVGGEGKGCMKEEGMGETGGADGGEGGSNGGWVGTVRRLED